MGIFCNRGYCALVATVLVSAAATRNVQAQLEEVIVTAQKRAETAQEVPIAITAFDDESLRAQQISTFADLRFAAPNTSYTKGNFTGSNFQIRGIGTSLVAASSDSGVGIHVNEVPLLYPRLFETEYYDVEQVAILRGPQGTLYGRNSTGGAVNMITRTPDEDFNGYIEAQLGDYDHGKLEGAVNIPLGDELAVRLAGIMLKRDGYTENVYTNDDLDDRDQYSFRASLRWTPGDSTTIDLMASYFDEDSTRTRSQKQLCKNDPSGLLGCLPDELAFETVNPLAQLTGLLPNRLGPLGPSPPLSNNPSENPHDMREVLADYEPMYEADETLLTLRFTQELDQHTFVAIAGYQDTSVLSQQDYNWNVSGEFEPSPLLPLIAPITYNTYFADGSLPISKPVSNVTGIIGGNIADSARKLDGYDQSNQETDQLSLELQLKSDYDGDFNFLVGGFYMEADTFNEYWVIATGLDYFAAVFPAVPIAFGGSIGIDGLGWTAPSFNNKTASFDLESKAVFGEVYYLLSETLMLTVGARYTIDNKDVKDVQFLFNNDIEGIPLLQPFGNNAEIPVNWHVDDEEWKETTGRVVLDWTPDLAATDSTLVYGSYSRGYKGGGFNPPFDPLLFPNTKTTFEPEFVDAFEIGIKNVLLDNRLNANLTAFFYDYEGLQVSKITNRTSFNENADAEIYGMEAEFMFAPDQHWLLNANISYLHTEIQDLKSVNTRDPTAGRSDVTLIKDNLRASNCVIHHNGAPAPDVPQLNSCTDLATTLPAPYTVDDGVLLDLDGKQLANSPEWTVSLGAQYTFNLPADYLLSMRVDYYWQDEMYGRIVNAPVDSIEDWDIWHAQATLMSPDENWFLRAYVKNIADDDNVVGMFVSDASSGLFTNVFTVEPRIYGLAAGYNFD